MLNESELRTKARLRAEVKVDFYIHLAVYAVVNSMLFVIWWLTDSFPWFVFPLLGWSVGLFAHFLWAFGKTNVTDRLADEEYQRLKDKQQ